MDRDDPVPPQQQFELGRFDLPLLPVHQRMNGNVNVVFKRFDFWPLILSDDILDRQGVDLEVFLKKAELLFSRRIEMKP